MDIPRLLLHIEEWVGKMDAEETEEFARGVLKTVKENLLDVKLYDVLNEVLSEDDKSELGAAWSG